MADFTVRVELHQGDPEAYKLLHARMFAAGYRIYIVGDDQRAHVLPTAEYDLRNSTLSVEGVRDQVMYIARGVNWPREPWCLVSQVVARAWSTPTLAAANAA